MYKKLIVIAFGRLIQILLTLVMLRLVTTFLSPGEMGRFSLLTAIIAFSAFLLVNPIGMFINRRLHSWNLNSKVKSYFNYHLLYLVGVSICVVCAICLLVSLPYFTAFFSSITSLSWRWLALLIAGSLFFNTLNQTYIPSLNLLGHYGWFVLLSIGTLLFSIIFGTMAVHYGQPLAIYWLLGILGGQALFALVGRFIFYSKINTSNAYGASLNKKHLKKVLIFSAPVAIAVAFNWAQFQSYRFVLESSRGLAELGLFAAGYQVSAGIFAAFEAIISTYFMPTFYADVNNKDTGVRSHAWEAYASIIFPLLIITLFFVAALAPQLAKILLSSKYYSAYPYIVWGAISEALRVVINVYGLASHAKMKTHLLLVPNAIGAIVSIVCALIFIPRYGVYGAGISLVSAGVVALVVIDLQCRRYFHIVLSTGRILLSIVLGFLCYSVINVFQKYIFYADALTSSLGILCLSGIIYMAVQFLLIYRNLQSEVSDSI